MKDESGPILCTPPKNMSLLFNLGVGGLKQYSQCFEPRILRWCLSRPEDPKILYKQAGLFIKVKEQVCKKESRSLPRVGVVWQMHGQWLKKSGERVCGSGGPQCMAWPVAMVKCCMAVPSVSKFYSQTPEILACMMVGVDLYPPLVEKSKYGVV